MVTFPSVSRHSSDFRISTPRDVEGFSSWSCANFSGVVSVGSGVLGFSVSSKVRDEYK